MSDDLDWRPLAQRLVNGWRFIALTALVAILAAVALWLLDENRYRAEAVLAVAKPDSALRFDERFSEPLANPAFPYHVNTLRTYGELARTPALAEMVFDRLGGTIEDVSSPADLLNLVRIRAMADGSLIAVEARATNPDDAADIANAWAEEFSDQMVHVFGGAGEEDATAEALGVADDALTAAEQALEQFHERSLLSSIEVEVANLKTRQQMLLEARDRLVSVERDLTSLRSRSEAGGAPDLADRLTALTLRHNALTSGPDAPIGLDLAAGGIDVDVAAADIDALEAAVAESRAALDESLAEVPAELAARSSDMERERAELQRLKRTVTLAEERYMTLSRRADELAVVRETARPELRMAASATPPAGPEMGSLFRNVLAALALGLIAGAALALVLPERGRSPDAR